VSAGMARALGTISALVTGLFVATWWSWIARCGASRFFNAASLDPLRLGSRPARQHMRLTSSELLKTAANLAANLRKEERALRTRHTQADVVDRRPVPASLAAPGNRSLSIGFYANWLAPVPVGGDRDVRRWRLSASALASPTICSDLEFWLRMT
jgi:hypothetical protein